MSADEIIARALEDAARNGARMWDTTVGAFAVRRLMETGRVDIAEVVAHCNDEIDKIPADARDIGKVALRAAYQAAAMALLESDGIKRLMAAQD